MTRVLARTGWLVAAVTITVLGIELVSVEPSAAAVVGTGAVLALARVVVEEVPASRVLEAFRTRRRQRRARRLHLRWTGRRGRLPAAASYAGRRELDARAQGERRVAAGEPATTGLYAEYVPRDLDPLLDECIAAGGLVILEGPAASGKTRSARAALRRLPPGRRLVVPAGPDALRRLADVGDGFSSAVVWLDDLELAIREGGLDPHVLERISRPGLTILATLRSEERESLEALDGQRGRAVAQLFGTATFVAVPPTWSEAEFHRAAATDDPLLDAAMANRHGLQITEYLAAAPLLLARWRGAKEGRHAIGAAVVTAALDARRCGYSGPIPRTLLAALAPHYLTPQEQHRTVGDLLEEGLAWAVTPVRGHAACLLPSYDDTFEPFDQLVAHRAATADMAAVPDPVWEVLADRMPVADVLAFAREAQREGRLGVAERVLANALRAHPTDVDLAAALGSVLSADPKRHRDAEDWLRRAAEAAHPGAMANLGRLLANDPLRADEAERWLRAASGETRSRVAAEAEAEKGNGVAEPAFGGNGLGLPDYTAVDSPVDAATGTSAETASSGLADPVVASMVSSDPTMLSSDPTPGRTPSEPTPSGSASPEPALSDSPSGSASPDLPSADLTSAESVAPESVAPDDRPVSDPPTGFLDAVLVDERPLPLRALDRILGRSRQAAAERFGVRVQRTVEWLAERFRTRHLEVLEADRLGPDWLPAPGLDRLLGSGVRVAARLLEVAVGSILAVTLTVVVLALEPVALPEAPSVAEPWRLAIGAVALAVGVLVMLRRTLDGPIGLPDETTGLRFKPWGPFETLWRWWAGRLDWLVAGAYGWAAAYLLLLGGAGDASWLLLGLGLLALLATAPFVIGAVRRRVRRWWQPLAVRPEPYVALYSGVEGAAMTSAVTGVSSAVLGGAVGLAGVRMLEPVVAPADAAVVLAPVMVAVIGAALVRFLQVGGLFWIRHLGTRLVAWRRGMSLSRRFFEVAAERGLLVRVPAGFGFPDPETRRDLARAYRRGGAR